MADSNITKRALAAALKTLMTEKNLEKISVGDICEQCDMNRKSFYYHFRDKYDLMNWIYDVEFIAVIAKKEYPASDTPGVNGVWELLQDLCVYFYENRVFYRKALQTDGQNSFSEHFREYLGPTLYQYLKESIPEEELLEFGIPFFTDAFIMAVERWLLQKEPQEPRRFLQQMKECMHRFGGT